MGALAEGHERQVDPGNECVLTATFRVQVTVRGVLLTLSLPVRLVDPLETI